MLDEVLKNGQVWRICLCGRNLKLNSLSLSDFVFITADMQQHLHESIAQLHCAVPEYPDSNKSWIWITPNAENSHHLPIDSIEIETLKILLDLTLILWGFDSNDKRIYHHQWQSCLKMISFSVLSKKIKIII